MSDGAPSAAALEAIRRGIDLRLDAEGRWMHEGEAFTHAGVTALFDRGLDLHPTTREPIVRIGEQWCYVRCDDLPFVVRRWRFGASATDPTLCGVLNTGAEVEVGYDALRVEADGRVTLCFADAREARVSRAAQAALAPYLGETPAGFALLCPNGVTLEVTCR